MTQTTPRVLIVEDDPVTASEIGAILAAGGLDCDRRASLAEAMARAADQPFDVIVLDRMLPDGDGIAAMQGLRAARPGAMILVVSALGTASSRIEGLDLGADDYLAKPFDPDELRARIRALLRRRGASAEGATGDLMQFGALQVRTKARTVHFGDTHVPLSPREFDLLAFFARHPGDVVTRMQLLEHVWDLHFDPQTNVVDVHVSRLRRKLDAALPVPVLHTARGLGYVFDPAGLQTASPTGPA
ncbi:MAG: response regulator transcription factor [Rhodobacteraceae bacterium]|nr:response regulator transcription factor [Paracoccaceae bacterium]